MKVVRGIALLALITILPGSVSTGVYSPVLASKTKTSWEGLAIVVNRTNPTTDLTLAQLRSIFLGERKWWTHRRRILLSTMRRGTPERQTVLRVLYRMDDRDLDKYFLYQLFKGEATSSLAILRTSAQVRKFVGTSPGAVGYLRASDVDDSVKVVRINGLLPEDDGYPLRLRARPPR